MSVYCLVGGLRRWLADAPPKALAMSQGWLRIGFGLSLTAYLTLKLAGVFVELPSQADLALAPAGVCALVLATRREEETAEVEEGGAARWPAVLAGLVLVVFTTTYITLNTVPMTSSLDENAIRNGAHELATKGSLQVASPLNDRYHTNIFGSLDATYRTPTALYHRVFPGTALSYAPFSALPGDSGYYFYTALFGTAAIAALYLLAWKLLGSWRGALVAALLLALSPAFGHWAATVFNNVPVLSLELGALALILWSAPPRGWQLGLAGTMIALAVFMRITELIFIPPLLALVWWRCRAWSQCARFAISAFSCVPLVLITNAIFFHNAFFFPHVGSGYLSLAPSAGTASSGQSLIERYFLYAIGVSGSASNFHFGQKVDNIFFHLRYLGSSTFAFPFLAVAFAGLTWWLIARRRSAPLLALAIAASVVAIIFLYGHQHNNYYGFGLPIARASFVRYSLPIYALLAIAGGAFFLETGRLAGLRGAASHYSLAALVLVIGMVGIARSYDWDVYGFNRFNYSREHDRTAWQQMDALMETQDKPALLIVGLNSMKLVDAARYPDTINYSVLPADQWDTLLFPVVTQVQGERSVYLALSAIQGESDQALLAFSERYFPDLVLRSGHWTLYRIEPAVYEVSP